MMRLTTAAVLVAGLLATGSASARGDGSGVGAMLGDQVRGKQRNDPAVFLLARRSSRGACAALAREERDARRRGDWWRADQLQDAYRDCLKRGG
jgi:hypothetical protein